MKPPAFLPRPNPKTGTLETSVFQVSGLTEQEVLEIGRSVSSKSSKTLYGRAILDIQDISNSGLCLSPDNIPPRHANIVDWPIEKSEQKAFALKLASVARLKLT